MLRMNISILLIFGMQLALVLIAFLILMFVALVPLLHRNYIIIKINLNQILKFQLHFSKEFQSFI